MQLQRLLSYVRRAVGGYNMISHGDRIAVGVSGGKDSLALLIALARLRQFYPIKFDICAITISMGFSFSSTDFSPLQKLCGGMGVQLSIVDTAIGKIIFDERKEENPCSLCSKMRKGALYNEAERLGCNVVALGHNRDDAVETFFMSLFYEGRIHTFPPVTELEEKRLRLIRPLVYTPEQDIKSFIKKSNFSIIENPCPANGNTARQDMKEFIKIKKNEYKNFDRTVFGAIERSNISGWNR